jgi:hypothetical protein
MSRPVVSIGVAALAIAAFASGCAASRASVTADTDRLLGPVSLSSTVPGPRGEILGPRDLDVVGQFSNERTYRSIAWGLLMPWRTWDATTELNEAMRRYQGEAIIELYVSTKSMSGGEALLSIFSVLVPIVPTAITLRMSGKVVRRKPVLLPVVGTPTSPPPSLTDGSRR